MKVLVTGAAGFIGRALSRSFQQSGHTVVALSRDPASAQRRVPWLSDAFPWDPLVQAPPPAAFADVDAVVHLAGESVSGRWTAAKKQAIFDSRVLGTRHLVAGMERLETRPAVLVSASATGFYGDRGDDDLTEEEPAGQDFLANVCSHWESEATAAEQLGVRVVRLRTGWVLGPGGGALAPMLPLYRLGLGGPMGSGWQWWPWVHQADYVALVAMALERTISGAVNITAPEMVRQREFARVLGRVLRRPALLPAPAFALKAVLGQLSGDLLASRRALPVRAQEAGFQFRFPTLEAALQDVVARWREG